MTDRILDIVINLSLRSLAREKLIRDGGYSLQDWKKECTLAFIAVAEELVLFFFFGFCRNPRKHH